MNTESITRSLEQFCGDFIIEDGKLFFNSNLLVSIIPSDGKITISWETPTGQTRAKGYYVDTLDDVIDVWSEYRYQAARINRLFKAALSKSAI
jgi:hypothetical protein